MGIFKKRTPEAKTEQMPVLTYAEAIQIHVEEYSSMTPEELVVRSIEALARSNEASFTPQATLWAAQATALATLATAKATLQENA